MVSMYIVNAHLHFSNVLNLLSFNWAPGTWGGKHKQVKRRTYKELQYAAHKFQDLNRLGQGDFGIVYLGYLEEEVVAVKRFSVGIPSLDHFKTELMVLKKLQHPNVVTLLGYCKEEEEKLLVYEYMPRSLKDLNFSEMVFDWKARMKVLVGVSEALNYLHNSNPRIIHGGLKDSTILLDNDFHPKLSGFGLSRLADSQNDPEMVSDVYEFGRLVFQIISGRRENVFLTKHGYQTLIPWAHRLLEKNDEESYAEFVDPFLKAECFKNTILGVSWLAKMCTHVESEQRPAIDVVTSQLKTWVVVDDEEEKSSHNKEQSSLSSSPKEVMTSAYGEKEVVDDGGHISATNVASRKFEEAVRAAAADMIINVEDAIRAVEKVQAAAQESRTTVRHRKIEPEAIKCYDAAAKTKKAAMDIMMATDAWTFALSNQLFYCLS